MQGQYYAALLYHQFFTTTSYNMVTPITNAADLVVLYPNKAIQHHPGNGIIIRDDLLVGGGNVSPNSITIIDRQNQFIKAEPGRYQTLYYQQPSLNLGAMTNTKFSTWKNTRLYLLDDRVLVYEFDMHPDDPHATELTRQGYWLPVGDVLYIDIDQPADTLNLYS